MQPDDEAKDNRIHLDPTIPPDEMLTMLIHDLRSPVASIETAASMLLKDDLTEEESTKLKKSILSVAQRMNKALYATRIYLDERKTQ